MSSWHKNFSNGATNGNDPNERTNCKESKEKMGEKIAKIACDMPIISNLLDIIVEADALLLAISDSTKAISSARCCDLYPKQKS